MTRRASAKILTSRDLELLAWVGRAGIAAVDQLARRFWAGRQASTALDRLDQLRRAGYLQGVVCHVRTPGEAAYALTREGAALLPLLERARCQIGPPSPSELRQQLLAQETRLRIEQWLGRTGGTLVDWQSEREIRAQASQAAAQARREDRQYTPPELPDARMVYRDAQGGEHAVDVEIDGAYYGQMLRAKVAKFAATGRAVWWACEPRRAATVTAALEGYPTVQVFALGE